MALTENNWVLVTYGIVVLLISAIGFLLKQMYAQDIALNLSFYEGEDVEAEEVSGMVHGEESGQAAATVGPNNNSNIALATADAASQQAAAGGGYDGSTPGNSNSFASQGGMVPPPANPILGHGPLSGADRKPDRMTPTSNLHHSNNNNNNNNAQVTSTAGGAASRPVEDPGLDDFL